MNTIAVIMSVYKNDQFTLFKEAFESLLNQTHTHCDIYIQFDGEVQKEISSYIHSLAQNNIFIYARLENKGLAISLNELLRVVLLKQYKYIARMDADDISLLDRFEKQISYLDTHPDVDCLGTWAIEIDDTGKEYFRKKMPLTHDECLSLFKKRDCMIHPTVMFRRSYFDKAGLYPEDTYFGEDTMMWAQGFSRGCQFANLQEYLFKFRLDENFFKRRRGWKHAKSILKLRHEVNKMLGFGAKENCWALLYAMAKMMPTPILNLIYKGLR